MFQVYARIKPQLHVTNTPDSYIVIKNDDQNIWVDPDGFSNFYSVR